MNEIVGGVVALHTSDDPSNHENIRTALATAVVAAIAAGSLHSYYIRFDGDGDKVQYKITAWSRPWLKEPTEALQITTCCTRNHVTMVGEVTTTNRFVPKLDR